jgi:2-polyprenyl-3-methyl-5-hydroxy-6-metoxy-1,4-benzoquinol methylase
VAEEGRLTFHRTERTGPAERLQMPSPHVTSDAAILAAGHPAPARPAWPELVCPNHRARLVRDRDALVCPDGDRWRVEAGIPRMVDRTNYAEAFGLQWRSFRKTQLDSHTRTTLSRDRSRRCIGEEWWRRLHAPGGLDVLEVGCGAGRFTEVLLSTGSRVTSVDMSSAVVANVENFPPDAHHRVIQADVRRLPFVPGQFDVVFCLGVIQHTPKPEETIARLYEQVKPGGLLVIDHYTYTLSELTKSAPLFRVVLTRTSPETGLRWTRRLVDVFLPLHKAVRHSRIAQSLLSRISPVLAYYQHLPLDDDLQREWALLDTHDSLTDRFKHFRTRSQIRKALQSLDAEAIVCEYGGNGVEARCRRPGGAD